MNRDLEYLKYKLDSYKQHKISKNQTYNTTPYKRLRRIYRIYKIKSIFMNITEWRNRQLNNIGI